LVKPAVLIVAVNREAELPAMLDIFCQELCTTLREKMGIRLAADTPLAFENIGAFRPTTHNLVVAVVGDSKTLDAALARVKMVIDGAAHIAVEFDKGTAQLNLSNASLDDIARLICNVAESLLDSGSAPKAVLQSAKVIAIGPSVCANDRERSPSNDDDATRAKRQTTLPSTETTNNLASASWTTALDWADAAIGTLTDILSDARQEGGGIYGLDWHDVLASVERLAGIADAPFEQAADRYQQVQAMLMHASAAKTPIVRTAKLLGLDDIAIKLLILVAAPELDMRFQRLYGALNDDMGRRHVTIALACAIIAASTAKKTSKSIRAAIARLDTLRALRLIDGVGQTLAAADEPLRIDPHVLDWLLTGRADLLMRSPALSAIVGEAEDEAARLIPEQRQQRLRAAVQPRSWRHGDPDQYTAVILTGSDPGWLRTEARSIAGAHLFVSAPPSDAHDDTIDKAAIDAVRASALLDFRLVADLSADNGSFWRALAKSVKHAPLQPYLLAENPAALLQASTLPLALVVLPPVASGDRAEAIASIIASEAPGDAGPLAAQLASRFNLPLDRMAGLIPLVRAESGKAQRGTPGDSEWHTAFRSLACSELPALANRVPPRPATEGESPLDRVVLPKLQRSQLETVLQHVRVGDKVLNDWNYGAQFDARGVSALFAGESGTGKTTAAHAIASALNTDLYVIDLAKIVSKYIGETEKNLDIAFIEAERASAVLLFDEADALFGKRSKVSDAHDRYANIEVAYLLQRMEMFNGLAILTTNHPGNIDSAFGRRLRFTIEFPFPEIADRLQIWERALPQGSPQRAANIEFTVAARKLELNGGSIRQIMLHALMAGADTSDGKVLPEHLQDASRTELRRLAKYDQMDLVDTLFRREAAVRAA
jgi:ATPase family associated with various cellular activities (AAA)